MQPFTWNAHFLTGLEVVDDHHRRLVDLTNRIGALLERPATMKPGELDSAFQELEAYADYHFTAEQSLMTAARVDPRHTAAHFAEHTSFLQEVERVRVGMAITIPEQAKELFAFLTRWLVYHILQTDKEMAREIAEIQAGQSPAQAFEATGEVGTEATSLLIDALQGLYGTLSRRNRQLAELNASLDNKVVVRTQELEETNRALVGVVGELETTREELRASSARYHAAVNTSLDGFCVLDDQGKFLEVNDRYCQLSGYSREEILGMTLSQLDVLEPPVQTTVHVQNVITKGSNLFETMHRSKDGHEWPVEVMATFWPQEGGRFFAFLRDISQRREAEWAVRESEQRFRSLFYGAPVGHALNRMADGCFLAVNDAFAAITGHTIEELNALSYWDLTPQDYEAQEAAQLESLRTKGTYGPYEKEYIHKDGRRIPVLLNGTRVTAPDGTELILSVVLDISQRRQQEEERENLIQSLQEALEEIRSLSGLLPICSSCKKIRDDQGYWQQIEAYIVEHSDATFTHGICPDCAATYFPRLEKDNP